jgi:hypothetical protein
MAEAWAWLLGGCGVFLALLVRVLAWPALQDWWFQGAEPGNRPFWRPGAPARVPQRFPVAVLAARQSGPVSGGCRSVSRPAGCAQ